ncbi:MAG: hypothetical protein U5L45_24840 [Saprospiraceae bacterium]|nr:hypothetical protein [Saprospiraceae bacterium]
MKFEISVFFVVLSVVACGKNETETLPNLGKEYFPLSIGRTAVFDLDSIIYDPITLSVSRIDTFKWQAQEILSDTFRSKSGNLSYVVDRSIKAKNGTEWIPRETFSASLTMQYALLSENNLSYIKFPNFFDVGTTWDGNLFNDIATKFDVAGEILEPFSKKWTFEILSFGKSEKIGNKDYTDVLTVQAQSDPKILTEKRYSLEKYAKGVGLVYREIEILDTQKLDATIAWEKKAQRGFIVKMTRIN